MIEAWLQKHKKSLLFLLILFSLGGILTAINMPVSLLPSISFPRIKVSIDSGDRPVNRMVIEVTRPLEVAIRSIPGVQDIRSTSSRGTAEINVTFKWGADMVSAMLQVEGAVNQAVSSLPTGTNFDVTRMDPTSFPVYGLSLTSDKLPLSVIYDFAEFNLMPYLYTVPGVSKIQIQGQGQTEYQIFIDPLNLRTHDITLADVATVLGANNILTAIGKLQDHYRLYLILIDSNLNSIQDINNIIVRMNNNGAIHLGDIATVKLGEIPEWIRVTANGNNAILMNIIQQPGANTVAIVKNVAAKLKQFKSQIPDGIDIVPYYDQSKLVQSSAQSVAESIAMGALFAAIVLFGFLRKINMTIIVAIILPCVLASTIVILNALDMSFNIMTLGGMAAAVGLIIDDGVVILEHIMRRLKEENHQAQKATVVMQASMQMVQPLTGSSLSTIIIFLPLAFFSGVSGEFFKVLAITMSVALSISFFYVFLAVPLLSQIFLKQVDLSNVETHGKLQKLMHKMYERVMQKMLNSTLLLFMVLTTLLIIAYFMFKHVGTGFMPHMDEGGFILDYIAKPGTSLPETNEQLLQVEKILMHTPEVSSYSRRTGLQLGGGLTETNTGDFFVRLKPPPRNNIDVIMQEVRQKIETTLPGLKIETAQLMEDMIGDLTSVPQPIEVKLFGSDPVTLQAYAKKIAQQLEKVNGVVEINDGIVISGYDINIKLDRAKMAWLKVDPPFATAQVQDLLTGNTVTQIQQGEKMLGVRVWSNPDIRQRLSQLENFPIKTSAGNYVSLNRIATINIDPGQAEVKRENFKSMLAITARIEGRDMGSTMQDVIRAVQRIALPTGMYTEYGGLYKQQQKSFLDMLIIFISALMLVTFLLLFLYENILIVASIIGTVLLSLCGVFLGLWLTKTELNLSSLMGMTMIIGIVTEVAIFYYSELVTYADHRANLISAGIMRMRPILMSSSITVLALLPLALGFGTGAAMQQPLAIAIISGLLFAVPLILIVMPAIYALLLRCFNNRPQITPQLADNG